MELWLYQARSAGRPFPFFGHKTVMKTNPSKACKTIDQGSGYISCLLPFQIDNLDSDTNQLASILEATRSNLDKVNSSLVNTTLEVGLGTTQTIRDLLLVACTYSFVLY